MGIIFRKDPYGLFHVLVCRKSAKSTIKEPHITLEKRPTHTCAAQTIAAGSPAESCGVIQKGDVLMNVNGHPAVGMSLAQVPQKSAV